MHASFLRMLICGDCVNPDSTLTLLNSLIDHKPKYRRKVFINQTLLIWDLDSTNYNIRNLLNGLHEILKNSAHQKKKFTNCIKIFTY